MIVVRGLDAFRQVWLIEFQVDQSPGEHPRPLRLVATVYRSGRSIQLVEEQVRRSGPPYPLGPDHLFVTYDTPVALGCHLALGWPLPARVLDLHAEFRCRMAGLLEPGDYDLAAALTHVKQEGHPGKVIAALPTLRLLQTMV
jgi:hypothetical protein